MDYEILPKTSCLSFDFIGSGGVGVDKVYYPRQEVNQQLQSGTLWCGSFGLPFFVGASFHESLFGGFGGYRFVGFNSAGFQRQYHIIYIWEFPKMGVPYLGTLIIRILILFIGVLY